jgi:Ca2+-transporting ATPase
VEDIIWHSSDLATVFQEVESSEKGLTSLENKNRLKKYGPNTLKIKSSESLFAIFLRQLQSPIVYVLLASTLLAFALNKFTDALVVFSVVILNTIIGFFQEYRANRIIKALSAMAAHEATVLHDNQHKVILASDLTLGDVILLEAGDKVPADARLFFTKNFQCDESILTGESLPVYKDINPVDKEACIADRKCMAFSGTYVTAGSAKAIVIGTGIKTEFGKISELVEHVTPLQTPLTLTLKKIAASITFGVVVASFMLFGASYLRGSSLWNATFSAITLAVAAIPEGLPAIITIASAIGVRRIGKRQALVRQLPAVEALGSTTVICTDKTGTLTRNEMSVKRLWTPSGLEKDNNTLLSGAILCSDAKWDGSKYIGDPTEIALLIAGEKKSINVGQLHSEYVRWDVIPFDSQTRVMAILNSRSILIKGAPEEILQLCDHRGALDEVHEMAREGMRVLAIAEKPNSASFQTLDQSQIKDGFTLLGLIGMVDPPREEARGAIAACFRAGIKIKMVTGDHPITAKSIGQELGLLDKEGQVMTGLELSKLNKQDWEKICTQVSVFARVAPEDKLKLVEALQSQGHVVAMTGDGVNDAAALKRADIGVAMGIKGTAVAKEASDIILADDNFASIAAAVEEGRRVYDNLIKALVFILPTSIGQGLIVFLAALFFPIHEGVLLQPILPVQILWVNLVVAVALSLPLAFEPSDLDIMDRPPRRKDGPLLSRFIVIRTLSVSILMAVGAIALFLWEYHFELSKGVMKSVAISEAQTMAVTSIILFQIFYLFHCRSLKQSIFKMSPFSNPSIMLGTAVVLIAQIGFIYLPFMNKLFYSSRLGPEGLIISTGIALIIFLFIGLEKMLYRKPNQQP